MPMDYQEDRPTPPSMELSPELIREARRSRMILARLQTHQRILLGLTVVGAVVLVAAGTAIWALTQSPEGLPGWLAWSLRSKTPAGIVVAPPRSLKELSSQYPELSGLLEDAVLGSVYKDFLIAYEEGGLEAAEELAQQRGLLNARGEIRITLVVDRAENVGAVVEELRQAGIVVEGSYDTRINVGVPFDLIQRLSGEEGTEALFQQLTQMEHIIRLELPILNKLDRVPSVEGEGVSITGAGVWHEAGVIGEGIRIGVLDLGFDGYRPLLGTELPGQVVARSFVYGAEPDTSDEVHGTACAEIVYEMAPGAELFFAYYDGTYVTEGQAVEWLLDQDVHIISHSANAVMAPMDGTGPYVELVDRAVDAGVLWVNSAGNEAESHYRGQFTDQDGDGLHEFPDGSEEMAIESYSDSVTVILNWNDWESVTEDYELFVYDRNGDLLASAEDAQDGSPGQVSAEGLVLYTISGEVYYVSVSAYKTSRPAILDIYVRGADIEFPVVDHSLGSPGDAHGALTVGATEYRDDSIATYSSQGPTSDGRLKPDLSAPAGVSGATYGRDGFDGTSASTPHVAGAAALVWSSFPELNRDEVWAYLTTNALDLGPVGPDTAFGYGRLQLPAPPVVEAEPVLPEATELPIPTSMMETLVPVLTPMPTLTPAPTVEPVDLLTTATPWAPATSSTSSAPVALLVGLAGIGLCGGTAVLGGAAMLLIARKESPGPAPARVPGEGSAPLPPPAPRADPAYGQLRAAGGPSVTLREGTITVGRGSENDVVLDDPKVSRHHARIQCVGGTCRVQDLDSSNGTFIDGERVAEGTLAPGSEVRFGGTTLVRVSPSPVVASAWLRMDGEQVTLTPAGLVIGRAADADLRLEDKLASRRHARIEPRSGHYVLSDLNSTNGTFVNERPAQVHPLQDGDRIRIGSTILTFRR